MFPNTWAQILSWQLNYIFLQVWVKICLFNILQYYLLQHSKESLHSANTDMWPLKPHINADFLPGISSTPLQYPSGFRGILCLSYFLHSIPRPKWFNGPFLLTFFSMISLRETPVLSSCRPLRFCFSPHHTPRNAFLSLSHSHSVFRAEFRFLFFHKAFLSISTYIILCSLYCPFFFITLIIGSKAYATSCCLVILSEVDFSKENVSMVIVTLWSASPLPQKKIWSSIYRDKISKHFQENELNRTHCNPAQ